MILSIESSCDDSSIAITEIKTNKLVYHKKISQELQHSVYGGVVPELAARLHIEALPKILEECDVEDKAELEGCYEDTWIVNLNPQLNSNRARRTRAEYERDNSGRQAEYYQQNKTKVTAQHKEYYHEHKEKINTRRQEKVPCECGGYYTRGHKSHHERTKKHLSKLNL